LFSLLSHVSVCVLSLGHLFSFCSTVRTPFNPQIRRSILASSPGFSHNVRKSFGVWTLPFLAPNFQCYRKHVELDFSLAPFFSARNRNHTSPSVSPETIPGSRSLQPQRQARKFPQKLDPPLVLAGIPSPELFFVMAYFSLHGNHIFLVPPDGYQLIGWPFSKDDLQFTVRLPSFKPPHDLSNIFL